MEKPSSGFAYVFALLGLVLLAACSSSGAVGALDSGSGFDSGASTGPMSLESRPDSGAPTASDAKRKAAAIYWLGDSITMGAHTTDNNGFRRDIYLRALDAHYDVDFVGSLANGAFPDNQHSGYGGTAISGASGRVDVELGPGKLIPSAALIVLMTGTNNMGMGITPFLLPRTTDEYTALLDKAQAKNPDGRICVTTILPIDPVRYPGPAKNVATFNGLLVVLWDAFDVAHPGRELIRYNANAAVGGPAYVAANFVDEAHPNETGDALISAALWMAIGQYLGSLQ